MTSAGAAAAAANPYGGEAGTPHDGRESEPPGTPGGAPSRWTGWSGTIEEPGRDQGPAAVPSPCSGTPGPVRRLRTGSGIPVGGSDGPPTGALRVSMVFGASAAPVVASSATGRTTGIGPLIGAAGSAAGPGVRTECRGT